MKKDFDFESELKHNLKELLNDSVKNIVSIIKNETQIQSWVNPNSEIKSIDGYDNILKSLYDTSDNGCHIIQNIITNHYLIVCIYDNSSSIIKHINYELCFDDMMDEFSNIKIEDVIMINERMKIEWEKDSFINTLTQVPEEIFESLLKHFIDNDLRKIN